MGWTSYSLSDRHRRVSKLGYYSKSADDIFIQNKKGEIHESMVPSKALIRESRDSEAHPNTIPIIIALDVTGSMRHIPHELVKDGLPNMVTNMIEKGVNDPAILFLGIGDHNFDRAPLQVGQFESGDVELDLWLTRTWLEGGGGGNMGESYLLAWYFGAYHTITDAYEKRRQKGFLFTIGDEPCVEILPKIVVKELMEKEVQANFSDKDLLKAAQEKYEVFHLHIMEGSAGYYSLEYWKNILGQHCIQVDDYKKVGNIIADTVISFTKNGVLHATIEPDIDSKHEDSKKVRIML